MGDGVYIVAVYADNTIEHQDAMYQNLEGKLNPLFKKSPALYWVGIGKDDFLYKQNQELRALLDKYHHIYTYYESEGGHTWRNWRTYLTMFLPQLFK